MSDVAAFRAALAELDVGGDIDPRRVVASPDGAGWLPEPLRAQVRVDAACARELAELVEAEAALLQLRDAEPVDPFFTARVIDALPTTWIGSRLSPHRRAMILGVFYAAAALVSWIVLTRLAPRVPAAVGELTDDLLAGSGGLGWPALATFGVAALAVFALAARKSHTPVA